MIHPSGQKTRVWLPQPWSQTNADSEPVCCLCYCLLLLCYCYCGGRTAPSEFEGAEAGTQGLTSARQMPCHEGLC